MGPCAWAPTCQPTDTCDLRPGVAVRRVKPIHSWASGRRLGGGGRGTGIVRHTLVESLGHTTWRAAPGKFEVKRHGALRHGNGRLVIALNGYFAAYVAGAAGAWDTARHDDE